MKGRINGKVAGGGVLLLLLLFFIGGVANQVAPPPADAATKVCSDVDQKPSFLAYDAATGANNFGPAVATRDVDKALKEFHQRLCTDSALASVHATYFGVANGGYDQYEARTKRFQDNHDKWGKTVKEIDTVIKDAKSVKIVESSANYDSLWFVQGSSNKVVPRLAQGPIPGRQSTLLVIEAKDGKTLRLRMECGFQPFEPNFPGVPPVKEKNPPKDTPKGGCKHNCNPPEECPPGTVPYEGRCVKERSDDGVGGNNSHASQPVQEHKQGGTPGADKDNPPPKDDDPGRTPDENGQSDLGSPGDGGAGPATGPSNDDHAEDDTTHTDSPECPLGPGNC